MRCLGSPRCQSPRQELIVRDDAFYRDVGVFSFFLSSFSPSAFCFFVFHHCAVHFRAGQSVTVAEPREISPVLMADRHEPRHELHALSWLVDDVEEHVTE